MRDGMKRLLLCLLSVLLILGGAPSAAAGADEPYYEVENAVNSNYNDEYLAVRTPFGEPCALYVEGRTAAPVTMMRITVASESLQIARVFVRPDEGGEFSLRIDTSAGNRDFPTAYKGTVVRDEPGGQTGGVCYDTMPGYRGVPTVVNTFCRVSVCCAYTEAQADGVWDGSWYESDNPLNGNLGFSSSEIVLHMVNNNPQAVVYGSILQNNREVRAQDDDLFIGSYAYDVYTDPFLKDIEGYMKSASVTRPLLPEQVDYLREQAEQITAGARNDYERIRMIYAFAAQNFFYDYQSFYAGAKYQYCNPYENLYLLRSGETSAHSIGGKVGTVCNGYAALIIAFCRAVGIPARMVCGYNGSGSTKVWNTITGRYWGERNHWWAEAYVDGRWVVMDADRGSKNSWRRSSDDWSVSESGWTRGYAVSYSGFDMNEETLSANYCYDSVSSRNYPTLQDPLITFAGSVDGYVTLRWEPVEGATGYYIYRGTVPETESMRYYDFSRECGYTSHGVSEAPGKELEEPDTTYYYRVRAVRNGVEGGRSNLVAASVSAAERDAAVQLPIIIGDPSDVTVRDGDSVRFSVIASGVDLQYRWQYRDGANGVWLNASREGSDTPLLTVTAALARDGYQYRCRVYNKVGEVFSSPAVLHVGQMDPPLILSQPRAVTASPDESVRFSVSAEGSDLLYQWQYLRPGRGESWTDSTQAGCRTNTLRVEARGYRSGYQYRCVVSNAGGSVSSEAAELRVTESIPPAILSQTYSQTGTEGSRAVFRVEATGGGLSYQWYSRPGSEGEWLAHSGPDGNSSSISLTASAARSSWQYYCEVSNRYGSVSSEPVSFRVTAIAPPLVLAQSGSVSVGMGSTAVFSVSALGFDLGYQWQYRSGETGKWTDCSDEGAQRTAYAIEARSYRNGYQYRCRISNGSGEVYSRPAMLTVTLAAAPVITRQPRSQWASAGDTVRFSVAAAGHGLSYQWQYQSPGGEWKDCSSESSRSAVLTVEAVSYRDGYRYRCLVSNTGGRAVSDPAALSVAEHAAPQITVQPNDVTARAGSVARFTVTASGSGLSYQWYSRSGAGAAWTACSGDSALLPVYLTEADSAGSGSQFFCRVSNAGGSVDSEPATLTVTGSAKPVILAQPQDAAASVGKFAVFRVSASGSGLSYQWYYRTTRSGAWTVSSADGCRSAALNVQAAEHRNGYQYRCKVSNASGSVYSDAATLTVRVPVKPYITQEPADQTVRPGDSLSFSVTAVGVELQYQWYALSPGSTEWGLCPGATEPTLSLTANAGLDGYRYCCRIYNDGGYIDSRVATLWVRAG